MWERTVESMVLPGESWIMFPVSWRWSRGKHPTVEWTLLPQSTVGGCEHIVQGKAWGKPEMRLDSVGNPGECVTYDVKGLDRGSRCMWRVW